MRLPFFRFKPKRPAPAGGLESFRSVFSKFQRIQKLNTRVLELMAEMERALGGEYIFDRAFLESSVNELSGLAYQVVYSLNAMSRNHYVKLFDRFQSIKSTLDDILRGGLGPFAANPTLPYSALGWEMEPLVGVLNVCLAETRRGLDLLAPDGFVVTSTGCRLFMEANGLADGPGQSHPRESYMDGEFPPELEEAVHREVKALLGRRPGTAHLEVRACTAGDYGRARLELHGVGGVAPGDIISACKLALAEYAAKAPEAGMPEDVSVALAVHEAVSAHVAGTVATIASPEFSAMLFSITAAPVGDPQSTERYLLKRVYPFELLQSEIQPKSSDRPLYPGVEVLSRNPKGLCRGSALLGPRFLKAIAECTLSVERVLGCQLELRWARGDAERPVILDIRPSIAPESGQLGAFGQEGAGRDAEVILRGGEAVQTGKSAGVVVHVSEGDDPERFPVGAVAVTRLASPRLSPILRKASAIITEVGTAIGHLATIARELRVPAIFGATGALRLLPEGIEATVDAGECTVYRGIVEGVLASGEFGELYPSDPEYVSLRRLLRWIMPLDMTDPESSDFCIDNCRTYHDIIHFAHEQSVMELLQIQERGRGLAHLQTRKLDVNVPMELFVLDIGGGLSPGDGPSIGLKDVASEPFLAFLRGLTFKEMWDLGPARLGLRDIFGGLDRTFTALSRPPEHGGRNHAIVAENYMNLGLRLGYHYSVIDSYLGGNVNQNYIYFRFVGGFADERRKRRRAEFIRRILEDMRFKVDVKGDLVVGKLKIADRAEMVETLGALGKLTGFSRQLDVAMASEEAMDEFTKLFREKLALDCQAGEMEDGRHA